MYPNKNVYLVEYDAVTDSVTFGLQGSPSDGANTAKNPITPVLKSQIPPSARFFAIDFVDPIASSVTNTNVAKISVLNKGNEIAQVIKRITAITGVPQVNIVAHSMGGLDARAYVENMASSGACYDYANNATNYDASTCAPGSGAAAYAGDVANIITVDTPHNGSKLATPDEMLQFASIFFPSYTCAANSSTNMSELLPKALGGAGLIESLNYLAPSTIAVAPAMNSVPIQAVEDYFTDNAGAYGLPQISDDIVVKDSQAITADSETLTANIPAVDSSAPLVNLPVTYIKSDTKDLSECYGYFDPPTETYQILHFLACIGQFARTQSVISNQLISDTSPWISSWSVTPQVVALGSSVSITYSASDLSGATLQTATLWRAPNVSGHPGPWGQVGGPVSLSGSEPVGLIFADTPPAVGGYWYGTHLTDSSQNEIHEPVPIEVTVNPASSSLSTLTVTSITHNGSSKMPAFGVGINASPADFNGMVSGTGNFALSYLPGTNVSLTAPPAFNGSQFQSWTGCDQSPYLKCNLALIGDRAVTASYTSAPPALSTQSLSITRSGSIVSSVSAGTVVRLTSTVGAGAAKALAGKVSFCDTSINSLCTGTALLGTAQLTSNGFAIFRTRLSVGQHLLQAIFPGTNTFGPAASPIVPLTVTGNYPTVSTIASGPGSVGGTFDLAGTVSTLQATPAMSGTISLIDASNANRILGSGTVSATSVSPIGFSGVQTLAGGLGSTVTGDFNNDGIPDLAGVAYSDHLVWVYLGKGDGTFSAGIPLEVGSHPVGIVAKDLNGDGNMDLAVIRDDYDNSGDLVILTGNGDGTFKNPLVYLLNYAPYGPTGLAVGDFNGDGIPDIATCTLGNSVSVMFGSGDGTFQSPIVLTAGSTNTGLAASDLNGDGVDDIVVSSKEAMVSVLLSNGDGTFQPPSDYAYAVGNFMAVGDINNDGIPDVVSGSQLNQGPALTVLLGNGDGTFRPPLTYAATDEIGGVYLADLNGDGFLDVVTPFQWDSGGSVYLNNGDGTFQPAAPLPISCPGGCLMADFNGDGRTDLEESYDAAGYAIVALNTVGEMVSVQVSNVDLTLGPGIHNIVAKYSGDSSFKPSVSIPVEVTPAVSLSATSLSFAATTVRTQSASQSITMTNNTTGPLQVSSIAVTGSNASSFVFASSCGLSLAAGANCTLHGHFAPLATGALKAAITITDSATNSPQTIALSGTGLKGPVTLSAYSLAFGSVNVGSSSASQTVVLTNTGTAAVTITSIAVAGTNASSFAFGNSCGASLAVGANCSIHGHFAPTKGGALAASITITDSATTSPQTIALTGTGVAPTLPVTLSSTSLSFGTVTVGTTSASDYITMTNTGSTTLTITSIALTGTNASSFVFANSCGASLAVAASCTIHGHFAPTSTGAKTAAVTITDSAVGSPQTITLTGTGQ